MALAVLLTVAGILLYMDGTGFFARYNHHHRTVSGTVTTTTATAGQTVGVQITGRGEADITIRQYGHIVYQSAGPVGLPYGYPQIGPYDPANPIIVSAVGVDGATPTCVLHVGQVENDVGTAAEPDGEAVCVTQR